MRLIENCQRCDEVADLYMVRHVGGCFYVCESCLLEYHAEHKDMIEKFLNRNNFLEVKEEND